MDMQWQKIINEDKTLHYIVLPCTTGHYLTLAGHELQPHRLQAPPDRAVHSEADME
jgi:hypothetical protein